MVEVPLLLELRWPLQYLMALSASFGNLTAVVRCVSIISTYDEDLDENPDVVALMTKYCTKHQTDLFQKLLPELKNSAVVGIRRTEGSKKEIFKKVRVF